MNFRFNIQVAIIPALLFFSPGSGNALDKPSLAVLTLRLNAPPGMAYLKGAYNDVVTANYV